MGRAPSTGSPHFERPGPARGPGGPISGGQGQATAAGPDLYRGRSKPRELVTVDHKTKPQHHGKCNAGLHQDVVPVTPAARMEEHRFINVLVVEKPGSPKTL